MERLAFFIFRSDYATEAYDAVAQVLGLEQEVDFFQRTLTGTYLGADVSIRGERNGRLLEIVVRTPPNAPRNLFLYPRDHAFESAVPTGDAAFDWKVNVSGGRVRVAAILDDATREEVVAIIFDHRAVFSNGAFIFDARSVATITGGPLAGEIDGRTLARFLLRVIDLGKTLADRAHCPASELLLANVVNDSRADVRRHNLALLVDRFPETREAKDASRSVLEHHDASLRLLGATHLSRGDPPDSGPIEALYRDDRVGLSVREAAFSRLLEVVPRDRRVALLEAELRDVGPLTRRALKDCMRFGEPPSSPALGRLLTSAGGALLVDVIRLIREQDRTEHEPLLIRLLDAGELDVKLAAVDGLARVGTAHAAEALRDIADGILTPARLRRACLDAVEQIRVRGGYEAGRLSIAVGPATGELSELDGGEVSLTDRSGAGWRRRS
jgi:hypothetical protein